MRVIRIMAVAAVLAVTATGTTSADDGLQQFFGSYSGFGFAEDTSGPFINTERDFDLVIGPLEPDGFELSWSTVKRKGSDPNSLEAEVSQQAASFRPSGKPGIYHAVTGGNVLGGEQLSWASLNGNLLTVYQLAIEDRGIPELHVYRRMMTPKGLELLFVATLDGKVVRTVRGRYRRR